MSIVIKTLINLKRIFRRNIGREHLGNTLEKRCKLLRRYLEKFIRDGKVFVKLRGAQMCDVQIFVIVKSLRIVVCLFTVNSSSIVAFTSNWLKFKNHVVKCAPMSFGTWLI